MKPTHKVVCRECNRQKILFDSEKKALNFIKFNSDEILEETGRAPIRAYYCISCGGYHVTSSKRYREGLWAANTLIQRYNENKAEKENKNSTEKMVVNATEFTVEEEEEANSTVKSIYQEVRQILCIFRKDTQKLKESLLLEYDAFQSVENLCGELKVKRKLQNIFKNYLDL